jgi:DNA-binding transcriptional regulator YhcF (GntR family)
MGAHWNVTIPEHVYGDYIRVQAVDWHKQQAELEYLKDRLKYVVNEFENVFESVEQHGYVELRRGSETLTLVEQDTNKDEIIKALKEDLKQMCSVVKDLDPDGGYRDDAIEMLKMWGL